MAELVEIEIFPKAQSEATKQMKKMLGDVMIVPNMAPIEAMKKSLQTLAPKMSPSAVANFEKIIQDATNNAMNQALSAQRRSMGMSPVAKSFEAGQAMVSRAGAGVGAAGGRVLGALPGIGGIAKLGGAASAAAGALSKILGPIGMIIDMAVRFVGAFNPALVEQLNRAWSDIMAVLGEALQPILEAMIPVVQEFGDAIQALSPIIKLLAQVFVILYKIMNFFPRLLFGIIKWLGGGESARGKSHQGTGLVGIEELGKSFQTAGLNRGFSQEHYLKMIAENTGATANNTKRKNDDQPRNPANG
jgi:hypothetical protein